MVPSRTAVLLPDSMSSPITVPSPTVVGVANTGDGTESDKSAKVGNGTDFGKGSKTAAAPNAGNSINLYLLYYRFNFWNRFIF